MFYEVFIPSNGADGFDVTITVEADNWMTALKSGLERTGQGAEAIRNVMCDIKEDNTIHVTDASTARVFVLREVDGEAEDAPAVDSAAKDTLLDMSAPVPEEQNDEVANFATQKMAPIAPPTSSSGPRKTVPPPGDPPPATGKFKRVRARVGATSGTHAPPPGAAPPAAARQSGVVPTMPASESKTQPLTPTAPPAHAPPPRAATPAAAAEQPSVVIGPAAEDQPAEPEQPSVVIGQPESDSSEPVQVPEQPSVVIGTPDLSAAPPHPQAAPPHPQAAPPHPQAAPAAPQAARAPDPADSIPEIPEESDGLEERSWTSEDGRMRIGSATFEALQREEPEAKVLSETRAPSGARKAVDIGRSEDAVSQNALEEVFLEINQIHEGEMTMEQVINYVMDLSMGKIGAEAGSIMFADVNGQELYFATARGPKAQEVMDFRVPMSKGLVGFCAREGVSLAISDAEKDPRFFAEISEKLGYETKNICCAPIQLEGRVYGAIELMNKSQPFTNTEVNVLTYIGRQLAKFVNDLIMAREKI